MVVVGGVNGAIIPLCIVCCGAAAVWRGVDAVPRPIRLVVTGVDRPCWSPRLVVVLMGTRDRRASVLSWPCG